MSVAVLMLDQGGSVQVRFTHRGQDSRFLFWSARDLFEGAAQGISGARWNDGLRGLLLSGPPLAQGLGTMGWQGHFTEVFEEVTGQEEEVWIRTHSVGGVLYGMVAHHVSPTTEIMQPNAAHQLRLRVRALICAFGEMIAAALPSDSWTPGQFAGPQGGVSRVVPLVLSTDKTPARVKKRWDELFKCVGDAAGITGTEKDCVLMGKTLAVLVDHDVTTREAALNNGLISRAMQAVADRSHSLWVAFLHGTQGTFSSSHAMMSQVAALSAPLRRLYGTGGHASSARLASEVKKRVADRKASQVLLHTTSKSKGAEVLGVSFDARTLFESLMAEATIRASMTIRDDCLQIGLSCDARTLARVPWWNTVYGFKIIDMQFCCNRPHNYYCCGHYDDKESVAQLLIHAKVSACVLSASRLYIQAPFMLLLCWACRVWQM